jgi:hypothetical protein
VPFASPVVPIHGVDIRLSWVGSRKSLISDICQIFICPRGICVTSGIRRRPLCYFGFGDAGHAPESPRSTDAIGWLVVGHTAVPAACRPESRGGGATLARSPCGAEHATIVERTWATSPATKEQSRNKNAARRLAPGRTAFHRRRKDIRVGERPLAPPSPKGEGSLLHRVATCGCCRCCLALRAIRLARALRDG